MKARELELCEIQRWYPRFKSLSLKTIILPLPESFISYLQEDGLFLPRDSEALPARQRARIFDDEDYQRWDEEDDEAGEPEAPSFPQLEAEVAASIAKLDGSVFPKLNWSAPKDSAWISSNASLRCTNFGEICLLLKASDSLVHDLSHAFDSCDDKISHRPPEFFLALRKWYDMRPEMEFRGFVRHGLLVGVSQREVTGFYPALLESQETLYASVFTFFVDSLSEAFELEDYTFDCYITRTGKVKLVDFNPWGAFTLPLLFTWDELEDTYVKLQAALSETCGNGDDMHSIASCIGSSLDKLRSSDEGGVSSRKGCCCVDSNESFRCGESSSLDRSPVEGFVSPPKEEKDLELMNSPSVVMEATHLKNSTRTFWGKNANITLWEQGLKAEFRIVMSNCYVQVNLRMVGGVPYDYVQTGPGTAWDEFLQRAGEEIQQQNKDAAAGG